MIIFTAHALKRMQERKVSRQQVAAAIKEPDLVEHRRKWCKIIQKKI